MIRISVLVVSVREAPRKTLEKTNQCAEATDGHFVFVAIAVLCAGFSTGVFSSICFLSVFFAWIV